MADYPFKLSPARAGFTYFFIFCFMINSLHISKLNGESCPYPCTCQCILVEEDESQRTRTATIVAGASVIALIGGVAALACCCSGHKKHSHSSSSSRSSHHGGDSYYGSHYGSHDSYYNHSGSSSHYYSSDNHHHNHSKDYSSNDFSHYYSSGSFYGSRFDPQILEHPVEGNLPARCKQLPLTHKKIIKESSQITGRFTTHPTLNPSNKGYVTAFVQLPDGTTQTLGKLPFSSHSGSSLSFGPFSQKGDYVFGMTVENGTTLSSQTKIGSVEIHHNGSTVGSREFIAPAHVNSHYEPSPLDYSL